MSSCKKNENAGPHLVGGPGYLSRYSYSLRDGRFGDRIPVGARFSALVHTGSGVLPAFYNWVPGLFPGDKAVGAWLWPPTPTLSQG